MLARVPFFFGFRKVLMQKFSGFPNTDEKNPHKKYVEHLFICKLIESARKASSSCKRVFK